MTRRGSAAFRLRYLAPALTLATLRVRVYDHATGAPLPGATVSARGPTAADATTDDFGVAYFRTLAPGLYRVQADRDDYTDNGADVLVPERGGAPRLAFMFTDAPEDEPKASPGGAIGIALEPVQVKIWVVERGAPAERAGLGGSLLRIESPAKTGRPAVSKTPPVTANGEAIVSLPKGAVYSVTATRAGYVTRHIEINVKGGETQPFIVDMDPIRQIEAEWVDTVVSCGDRAVVKATITPPPPDGTRVEFHVHREGRQPTNDPAFVTMWTTTGGAVRATWVAKAASAAWRTDKMRFRVVVASPASRQTGASANALSFKDRLRVGPARLHIAHPNAAQPAYPILENHDASLEAHRVLYEIRLRLLMASTLVMTNAEQDAVAGEIMSVWNAGFSGECFHRGACDRGYACDCQFDCCKVGWHLDVKIVSEAHHLRIWMHGPDASGRWSSTTGPLEGNWGFPSTAPGHAYAHEAGHMLGQYDEYPAGVIDPSGEQPAEGPRDGIMCLGNHCYPRHFRWVSRFLTSAAGEDYVVMVGAK